MVRLTLVALLLCVGCAEKEITTSSPTLEETNTPPSATINSPYPGEQIANGALFVAWGEVSDVEDRAEDLLVSWFIGGEERCGPNPPTEAEGRTRCDVSFSFDKQRITMLVVDSGGETAEQTVDIQLTENTGPSVSITSPMPEVRYRTTDIIAFEGMVSDGEDVPAGLAVRWESDEDGVLDDIGMIVHPDGRVTGTGTLSVNRHLIRLVAQDTSGRENNASVIIDVAPPAAPPQVRIDQPIDGAQFEQGQTINFRAEAMDELTRPIDLQVEWRSNREAAILNMDPPMDDGVTAFATSMLDPGEHVITLTVTDEDSERAQDSVIIEIVSADETVDDESSDGDDGDDATGDTGPSAG